MYLHLKCLTKFIILVKKPYIVLVVWIGEKAIVREKLKDLAIKNNLNTRDAWQPYNTYFGVLLDFLNLNTVYWSPWKRFGVYLKSWAVFLKSLISFPEYVFLQWWIDQSGESQYFLKNLDPNMIVFTDIKSELGEDYSKIYVIQQEFSQMIWFLNKKAKSNFSEIKDLSELIDIIQTKNNWVWVVYSWDPKIKDIWSKLSQSIAIK